MSAPNEYDSDDETEKIAKRAAELAESRVMLKFAWFLIVNVGALVGVAVWLLSHIYSLETDVASGKGHMSFNDSRIERLTDANIAQDRINEQYRNDMQKGLQDIRNMFYEHDRNLQSKPR